MDLCTGAFPLRLWVLFFVVLLLFFFPGHNRCLFFPGSSRGYCQCYGVFFAFFACSATLSSLSSLIRVKPYSDVIFVWNNISHPFLSFFSFPYTFVPTVCDALPIFHDIDCKLMRLFRTGISQLIYVCLNSF